MTTRTLVSLLLVTALLASCKVVNTHVVKLTSTPDIGSTPEVLLQTTKGNVYLAAAQLGERGLEVLRDARPFQCIAITTSEPFDMDNREVHFKDFKFKKLVESDDACRKVKTSTRIYGN